MGNKSRTLSLVFRLDQKSEHERHLKVRDNLDHRARERLMPAVPQLKVDFCKYTKYQENIENSYALIYYLIVQVTSINTSIEVFFLSSLQAMRLVHVSVVCWKFVSTTLQQLRMMTAATFFFCVHV